jgi:hypothetical protein
MGGILNPLLARFRRGGSCSADIASGPTAVSTTEDRLKARSLAEAIDRAMAMRLWAHAERLAETALRLGPNSACLTERVARLRLAQGRPQTALDMIESTGATRSMSASMRLLRAACLVQLGRKEDAHLDLLRWSARSTAPIDARLMLALLEWEGGDEHAAVSALRRNLRHLEDPRSLELLLLIAARTGRVEQADAWAARLRESSAFGAGAAHVDLLCGSLNVRPDHRRARPTEDQVHLLAMELIAAEQVIASLVEAQRLDPQPETADLLYKAIEHALIDLNDQVRAMEALARLALILGNGDAARRWAQEGLARNPMSATLTMIARELADPLAEATPEHWRDVLANIGDEADGPVREKAA